MDIITIGHWAFFLGLIVSILAGFTDIIPSLPLVLFVLGLVVGFLNITEKENTPFLISIIALLVIGLTGSELELGRLTFIITAILDNLISFVSAAGLVVAIKQALVMAKKR